MSYCSECGTKAEKGDLFCAECGTPIEIDESEGESEVLDASSDNRPVETSSVQANPEPAVEVAESAPRPASQEESTLPKNSSNRGKWALAFSLFFIVVGGLSFVAIQNAGIDKSFSSSFPDLADTTYLDPTTKPAPSLEEPSPPSKPAPTYDPPNKPTPTYDPPPKSAPAYEPEPTYDPPPPKEIRFSDWKFAAQKYVTGTSFPEDDVKDGWAAGYRITQMTHGQGSWVIVMSTGLPIGTQAYMGGANMQFPEKHVMDFWAKGYAITDVAFGDSNWVVIMSTKTLMDNGQKWITRNYFPREEIAEAWDDGFHVSKMAYGGGAWAVVFSKNTGLTGQSWLTKRDTSIVYDDMKEKWEEGFQIDQFSFGANSWAVLYSKGRPFYRQAWNSTSDFPSDYIDEKWDEGYRITHLDHGLAGWAVIMAQY